MSETGPKTRETTRTRPKTVVPPKPPLFKVILHNDHFTTMEFVIDVLQRIFQKSEVVAVQIMMQVHVDGLGIAGVYPADIAETKIQNVHELARKSGFPLRCSMEPE